MRSACKDFVEVVGVGVFVRYFKSRLATVTHYETLHKIIKSPMDVVFKVCRGKRGSKCVCASVSVRVRERERVRARARTPSESTFVIYPGCNP
jgi:hypothetical protein